MRRCPTAGREFSSRFLASLPEGKLEAEAFRSAFQCDYAALEKEVRLYIGQDVYPVRVFTFQERLAKIDQLISRPLSEAEVAYYQGD